MQNYAPDSDLVQKARRPVEHLYEQPVQKDCDPDELINDFDDAVPGSHIAPAISVEN